MARHSSWFAGVPEDPFYGPREPLWWPAAMREAPPLPELPPGASPAPRTALLINPFYPKSPYGSYGKHVLTPSLSLISVAAATPSDWQIRFWDENLLQGSIPVDPLPEAVGITVHLTTAGRAYALADWFRNRGSKVVLGGMHVHALPDEPAPHADTIAIGDGVQLWPRILADLERGALQPRYCASYERSYQLDPPPRRDLLPRNSFLTTANLVATRGCHNRCHFCFLATDGLHMPYRVREPGDIRLQLLAERQPYAVFIDNNLGARKDYLRSLCRALRPLNRIWSSAISLDVTDDPYLVREMALAGCTGVFVGFETLNDENLVNARKRAPKAQDYARRVQLLHDHGIQVNGSFVVGFDGDDPATFGRLAAWIEDNRLECATFHILTPYPGTPLFNQLEREGRLLHRDWDKYDTAHVVFRPKQMRPEELLLGYDWLYRRLFSHASIWRRRPRAVSAVPTYLAGSYLYKRANRLWYFLIRHRLVRQVWWPLVELTRVRHLAFRRRLLRATGSTADSVRAMPGQCVPAGL